MQNSEILHLLGHFSGSAGSWDVFRGGWQHTAISRILLWRGVLSRAQWVLCVRFSASSTIVGTCRVAILNRTFRIFHRNFVIFVRRLLDGTSSPGGSLSSPFKSLPRKRSFSKKNEYLALVATQTSKNQKYQQK